MQLMSDETKVEPTTDSPSEETKAEGVVETPVEVKEEKAVPYDRFKEVVDERNKYKELLSVKTEEPAAEPAPDYDEALKVVDKRAEEIVNKKIAAVQRQIDLDKTIAKNPDFYKYAEAIKVNIQENPNLSWENAYKLAKFEAVQMEAAEAGKKAAYQKIEEKKSANVESAVKTKSQPGGSDEINPLAKGPDGKFLYTTKELEDILPKR